MRQSIEAVASRATGSAACLESILAMVGGVEMLGSDQVEYRIAVFESRYAGRSQGLKRRSKLSS